MNSKRPSSRCWTGSSHKSGADEGPERETARGRAGLSTFVRGIRRDRTRVTHGIIGIGIDVGGGVVWTIGRDRSGTTGSGVDIRRRVIGFVRWLMSGPAGGRAAHIEGVVGPSLPSRIGRTLWPWFLPYSLSCRSSRVGMFLHTPLSPAVATATAWQAVAVGTYRLSVRRGCCRARETRG